MTVEGLRISLFLKVLQETLLTWNGQLFGL